MDNKIDLSEPLTKEQEKAFILKLSQNKIKLMRTNNAAFICTVCFSVKHSISYDIPTAATNGTEIIYNPNFMNQLGEEYWIFVILHETWHIAFNHCSMLQDSRIKNKNPILWNIAGDYVINLILQKAGFNIPDMALVNDKYDNMTTEQVYESLLKESEKQIEQLKQNNILSEDLKKPELSKEEYQIQIENILAQAATAARVNNNDPGTIPGEINVAIEKLFNPLLPWHIILRKFLTSLNKNDYSFSKLNRRFLNTKYRMPSLHSDSLGKIAMAIDMSGSVSDKETTQFISDVYSVIHSIKPEELSLVQFDTNIKSINKIKTVRDLNKVEFTGRGGTSVTEVIKWAKENKPDVICIFSDGYFNIPDKSLDPKIPVLWIIHNQPQWTANFGKVIHYNIF